MTTTRYAEDDTQVYDDPRREERASRLQRALHSELCRGSHKYGDSACWRALQVVRTMHRLHGDEVLQ